MANIPRFSGASNKDNTDRLMFNDYQAPAYAATIALAIAAKAGFTLIQPATLTGAVTFTANVGTATTAPFIGDTMLFLLVSDGTTRTATFSTGFAVNGAFAVTTGKYGSIEFIFNGSLWVEIARTVTA